MAVPGVQPLDIPALQTSLQLLEQDPMIRRLDAQLLPVGGASTVRGYRENLLVRDNGLVASVEWQTPLFTQRASTSGFDARHLRLSLFIDYGRSWNDTWEGGPSTAREHISSAGVGLLWKPLPGVSSELYWAHALNDVATAGDDIQDDGIHYRVSWSPWN